MAKSKKGRVIQFQPISVERYIKEHVRKLPFSKCFIVGDDEFGIQQVIVTREKRNGNIIVGFYLVDRFCLGLKDSFFREYDDFESFYEEFVLENEIVELTRETDPIYAMNLIYGSIEFAEDAGFSPAKDFKITEYILDDVEDLEFVDIEFGMNGRYFYCPGEEDNVEKVLATLEKNIGLGNFDYSNEDADYEDDNEELDFYERYTYRIDELDDLSEREDETFMAEIINKLEGKYSQEVGALFTMLFIIASGFLVEMLETEDFNEIYKKNPEIAVESLKNKFYKKNSDFFKSSNLDITDFDSFPLDAIVFNNMVFDSYSWVYLPEFADVISKLKSSDESINKHFFEFYAPVKEKIAFYFTGMSYVLAEDEFGYDPMEMNRKKQEETLKRAIDLFDNYFNMDEDEILEYFQTIRELELIFEYFPKPSKKELLKMIMENF